MARAVKVPNLPKLPTKLKIPRLPDIDEEYEDVFEEMTLAEHLNELRSRVMKSCYAIGVSFVIGFLFADDLLEIIRKEANATEGIGIISPTEPFTVFMKIALYIAIAIASPILLYQAIAFLAPGLTRREKRVVYASLPFVSGLFILGAAFAFFFAAPRAFTFLSSFQSDIFQWTPNGPELINFYLTLMIGMGVAFELPLVMFLLAKLNIVSPARFSAFRRYAAICIMVAAAVITPTPDPFNMMFVAAPMFVLYELGIILGKMKIKI
jgi:sec-independent protein translocase protein TatC